MPDDTAGKLVDNRYLILITRLLVDQDGNLQQGILVDLDERTVGKFRYLDELPELIGDWLRTPLNKPNLPSD